jgi:transcriptional regulator with XRE-family HTH domain
MIIAYLAMPHVILSHMYGPILKNLRESKDRTQAEVARSVGMSPAQLARLESDQRGLYVDDFVRIAAVLGEKAGNLLPNDLGDIARLKPIIDRLAAVKPELLARVMSLLDGIMLLTEDAAASPKQKSRPPARKQT